MSERTTNLGRYVHGDGTGTGTSNRAVSYWNAQMVHLAIAIASFLFNTQLPGDVIAMLLGLSLAASSNEQISRLIAAVNVAVYSNGQILQLNAAYSNYTGVIYTSLTTYFMIQVPIFAAIFSAQEPGRCQIWWTAIIVSGLTSAAIIVALFLIFILQFKIRSRTRQLRQQLRRQLRRQLGEEGLSVVAMTMPDGWTIVVNAAEEDDDLDINWITQRAAFLLILMAISVLFAAFLHSFALSPREVNAPPLWLLLKIYYRNKASVITT